MVDKLVCGLVDYWDFESVGSMGLLLVDVTVLNMVVMMVDLRELKSVEMTERREVAQMVVMLVYKMAAMMEAWKVYQRVEYLGTY